MIIFPHSKTTKCYGVTALRCYCRPPELPDESQSRSGETCQLHHSHQSYRQEGIQRQALCHNRSRKQHRMKLSALEE